MRSSIRYGVFISMGISLLSGCQHASTVAPELAPAVVHQAPVYDLVSGDQSLVAMYELNIDLTAGTASATPISGRSGAAQPPQAQQYDLDIANFLTPQGFTIQGITVLPSGDVRVSFQHAHPFPAPNPGNPITGLNRADLSYTGRCLILASGSPQSFFAGTVTVSPNTVLDADGYLDPGDLIAGLGLSPVNVFPYMLLADDGADNRIGVSNGGSPEGNYDPAQDGWQLANLGATGTGWTGYDYVHGGQTIANEFTLSQESLSGGFFRADVAILIKYTDPRGQGGATRRLPPSPADPLAFAYRLPYSALDMSVIENEVSPLEIGVNATDAVGARFFVRDWDATAEEAADATLGDETDVALIQPGAAGKGLLSLDCPALSATPATSGGSAGSPSGHPGDELAYRPTLTNALGTANGRVYALARIADPEINDPDRDNYAFGVDPLSLIPSASRAVAPVTYQVLPVDVGTPVAPGPPVITLITPSGILGASNSYEQFSATATGDPFLFAWNFGPGISPSTAFGNNLTVQLGVPGFHEGTLVAVNAYGSSAPTPFTYEVLGPPGLEALYSDPAVLLPDISARFSAITLGVVDIYNWEFPAGFGVPNANDAEPVLFVPSTPGQYLVSLSVSNSAGASPVLQYPFVVEREPSPGWSQSVLRSDYGSEESPAITIGTDGYPVIAYVVDGATSQLQIAQALTEFPGGVGDWLQYTLSSVTGESIRTPKLALVEDKLTVGYVTETRLRYARSTVENPPTAGDWAKSTIHTFSGSFELLELLPTGTTTHFLAWDAPLPLQGVMRTGRSLVTAPSAEADWLHYPFSIDATQFVRPVMCDGDEWPAIAVANQGVGLIQLGIPTSTTPMSASDWGFTAVSSESAQVLSLRLYGAAYAMAYARPDDAYRLHLRISTSLAPTGPGDWAAHRVTDEISGVTHIGMGNDGSRLWIVAADGILGDLTLSTASSPDAESDWTTEWLATYGYQGDQFAFPVRAEAPYVTYIDSQTDELVLRYPTP